MDTNDFSFLPGCGPGIALPLARFLPPIPTGMVSTWLEQNTPPGAWVLDPMGSTPAIAMEAARAGYRVLITANNPIISFMLEVLAGAPTRSDFRAALADIGAARRGEERLEIHLKSLYMTECAVCGETISAQAFLWKRDEELPFARLYHCPACGDEGERALTPRDLERLSAVGRDTLHRARAIERVGLDGEALEGAREALSTYLSRPLYVLFTLLNKIEGLPIPTRRRQLLWAIALSACDQGCSLWPWPASRSRPRQLATPPQFRENNLWAAMEEAVEDWATENQPIVLTRWPELPPAGGGICLFPGRLKALMPVAIDIKAALAAFPRPNQAFWTLSALWSGWIWGRESVLPLRTALERRRYDWSWHATALRSPLEVLQQHGPADMPILGILSDLVPGFLSAAVLAASSSGFQLQGIALREDPALAQAVWKSAPPQRANPKPSLKSLIIYAIQTHLEKRNEPAPYAILHASALAELANTGVLTASSSSVDLLSVIQNNISEVFSDSRVVKRFDSQAQTIESGLWGLTNPGGGKEIPLTDQIEMEVVRFLEKNSGSSLDDLDRSVCSRFPGLFTPSLETIQICLDSYAVAVPQQTERWQLAAAEKPSQRRVDLQEIRQLLIEFGAKLGLSADGDLPLIWHSKSGERIFAFYIFASSIISRFVFNTPPLPAEHCALVFPGSRSKLLAYKLARNPQLASAASGWQFVKFRQLRRLAEQPGMSMENFNQMLGQDPPRMEEATQMVMF